MALGTPLLRARSSALILGLHTVEQIETLRAGLEGSGMSLVACSNGVDAIWTDRPTPPNAPAWAHPPNLCGETAEAKIRRLGASIAAQAAQTAVITLPDSLCWLLNLRGRDVPRTPDCPVVSGC